MITREDVVRVLDYNPATGEFVWRRRPSSDFSSASAAVAWNAKYAGRLAGASHSHGYNQICVNYRVYLAHRLAWLITYGRMPIGVDHIDRDPSNNRIVNLREADQRVNGKNQSKKSNNTSGFNGVHFDGQTGKWRAQITVNGRGQSLGRFHCLGAALRHRRDAEVSSGFSRTHGRDTARAVQCR